MTKFAGALATYNMNIKYSNNCLHTNCFIRQDGLRIRRLMTQTKQSALAAQLPFGIGSSGSNRNPMGGTKGSMGMPGASGNPQQNMMEAMQKTNELLSKMKALQEELARKEVVGHSGEANASVSVTFSAAGIPLGVQIGDGAKNLDTRTLEALLLTALNDAYKKSGETQKHAYENLYKEYGIPMPDMAGGDPLGLG